MKQLILASVALMMVVASSCKKNEEGTSLITPSYTYGLQEADPEEYARIPKASEVARLNQTAGFPSSVDLSGNLPAIADQGSFNACVSFTVAYYLKSYQEYKELNWDVNRNSFSATWLNNQVYDPATGVKIQKALDVIVNTGADFTRYYPYTPGDYKTQPTTASKTRAGSYRAASYATLDRNVDQIKSYLVAGTPVIWGLGSYDDFKTLNATSNIVFDDLTGGLKGKHSVLIVGYDESLQAFKVANSWGKSWGQNGYGWVSYNMVTNLAYTVCELYILIDQANTPEYSNSFLMIKKNNTGSGYTEAHRVDAAYEFQTYRQHLVTALGTTGPEFFYTYGDYNNDGVKDLYAIKRYNTGTNSTEVHILDGSTNFSTFLLHTGTALSNSNDTHDFDVADYNRDGKIDLYVIIKSNTGSGKTEVHVLDGASNYTTFLVNTISALGQTDGRYDFAIYDYNLDFKPDLIINVKNNTGSGYAELHVLSGADYFNTFLTQRKTCMPPISNTDEFAVTDFNGDLKMDMVFFRKSNTASGATEISIVNGGGLVPYQSYIINVPTAVSTTDANYQFLMR